MPAMRAQASSVYIAIITIAASSGPILVRSVNYFISFTYESRICYVHVCTHYVFVCVHVCMHVTGL